MILNHRCAFEAVCRRLQSSSEAAAATGDLGSGGTDRSTESMSGRMELRGSFLNSSSGNAWSEYVSLTFEVNFGFPCLIEQYFPAQAL